MKLFTVSVRTFVIPFYFGSAKAKSSGSGYTTLLIMHPVLCANSPSKHNSLFCYLYVQYMIKQQPSWTLISVRLYLPIRHPATL